MGRTHVILDDEVMSAIDKLVGHRGRSRFLEAAAREKLERSELDRALESSAAIVTSEAYPEFKDQTTINRWVRSQRRSEEVS